MEISHLLTGAVMLSEALQRNAKHEARAFKHLGSISTAIDPEKVRDSSLRSE
jgi:hypothetical protein